jgi:hypothetical protein
VTQKGIYVVLNTRIFDETPANKILAPNIRNLEDEHKLQTQREKKAQMSRVPIILPTWEADFGRILVGGHPW